MLKALRENDIEKIKEIIDDISICFNKFYENKKWEVGEYDTEYCVTEDGFLLFDGSDSVIDWVYNLYFFVKKLKTKIIISAKDEIETIKTHGGFLEKWLSVRQEIVNKINNKNIKYITGFSQGAAIATLAYLDLKNSKIIDENVKCVVFASPRVFFFPSKNIREFLSNLINYQLSLDIVTKLPLFILGFRHVGIKLRAKPIKDYCEYKNIIRKIICKIIPSSKFHNKKIYIESIRGIKGE